MIIKRTAPITWEIIRVLRALGLEQKPNTHFLTCHHHTFCSKKVVQLFVPKVEHCIPEVGRAVLESWMQREVRSFRSFCIHEKNP